MMHILQASLQRLLGRCSALLRADSHSYSTLIDFLSVRVARI